MPYNPTVDYPNQALSELIDKPTELKLCSNVLESLNKGEQAGFAFNAKLNDLIENLNNSVDGYTQDDIDGLFRTCIANKPFLTEGCFRLTHLLEFTSFIKVIAQDVYMMHFEALERLAILPMQLLQDNRLESFECFVNAYSSLENEKGKFYFPSFIFNDLEDKKFYRQALSKSNVLHVELLSFFYTEFNQIINCLKAEYKKALKYLNPSRLEEDNRLYAKFLKLLNSTKVNTKTGNLSYVSSLLTAEGNYRGFIIYDPSSVATDLALANEELRFLEAKLGLNFSDVYIIAPNTTFLKL